jgi:phosphatidate cytidylyltransferase
MLRTRVITALVLLVLFLSALFGLPQRAWAVFAGLLMVPAAWEWGRLIKFRHTACGLYVVLVAAAGASLYLLAHDGDRALFQHAAYIGAGAFWVIVVPLWLWRSWLPHSRWLAALTGIVLLVPTWLALVELRGRSPELLLLLMAVAWISDTAAYFAGRRFGRHKLAPSISPGKTWEGVAGAMLAVSAYGLLWSYAWEAYFPPVLQSIRFGACGLLLFLWLLAAAGIYGDLLESAVKRRAAVKDSGSLLPGHGGVLDRIDALTAVLPLAALVYLK